MALGTGSVMSVEQPPSITVGDRLDQLAAERPAAVAITQVARNATSTSLTWGQLRALTDLAARGLADRLPTPAAGQAGPTVAVALPSGLDHVVATVAAWKLGALVVPLDPAAPPAEQDAIAAALGEHLLIADSERAGLRPGWWRRGQQSATGPVPSFGPPRSASLTGGTTGLPRVIVRPRPWAYRPGQWLASPGTTPGMRPGQVQLLALPAHHTGFNALYQGLVLGQHVVVMERFTPTLFLRLVAEYQVNYVRLVAPLMRMVTEVRDLARHDLSSLEAVHHGAGPCPAQVKRAWLDLVGPQRLYEVYTCQERIGSVLIRGDEWLRHPGSVGRPTGCEIRILDEHGNQLPTGQVGEVYLRSPGTRQPTYLGDGPPLPERDGFLSVGDLGRLDEDGYLYLADRRSSVINVGGQNVYPAEVEAVLLELDGLADAAVTSRPHPYLGQAVHALVVAADPDNPVPTAVIDRHCRERLSAGKVPMSYQLVAALPRSGGKLRRGQLPEVKNAS